MPCDEAVFVSGSHLKHLGWTWLQCAVMTFELTCCVSLLGVVSKHLPVDISNVRLQISVTQTTLNDKVDRCRASGMFVRGAEPASIAPHLERR